MSFAYNRLSKNHNHINWAIQWLQVLLKKCIHNNCELGNEYNSNLSSSLTIISHRTTQVIHQFINTIILNWVGGSDLSTHDTLCWRNSTEGNGFQIQCHGLNATIIALNNPGLNLPLHSYYPPKLQPRLIQANSRQQVTNLTLQEGSNKASHDKNNRQNTWLANPNIATCAIGHS